VADELVGTRADGLLLEGVRAHLLVVLLGHHPAGAATLAVPKRMAKSRKGSLKTKRIVRSSTISTRSVFFLKTSALAPR
jgi:hypothetical protein